MEGMVTDLALARDNQNEYVHHRGSGAEASWSLMCEFSYNNDYHASIGMPPHETLYGRKCRSPIYWDEVGEHKLIGPELIRQTKEKVKVIRKRLIAAQDRQKKYADQDRKDLQFKTGDKVLLKISPWKGLSRFRKKGKIESHVYWTIRST
ncbi:hypothetical protein AgCh_036201 [Apium graveolens]